MISLTGMDFNVRVYGLLIEGNAVLISRERVRNTWVNKFPGGGLEKGEGTIDCLQREFKEELNWEIEIVSHYYTTDFYVKSAYDDSQIVSIYYLVEQKAGDTQELPQDTEHQQFYWLPINAIGAEELSLIIDKKVAEMLKERIGI